MTNNIDLIHSDFPASTALPLWYRTYSRRNELGTKESPKEGLNRSIKGLSKFGLWSEEDEDLVKKYVYKNQVFPSGRWLWVGGTEWIEKQKNFIGAYNCASLAVTNWDAFRFNFRALLMGCGVGTVVELTKIKQLPEIQYPIKINVTKELGLRWIEDKAAENSYFYAEQLDQDNLTIDYVVGDSKEGWVSIATHLLEFASIKQISSTFKKVDYKSIILNLDLSQIRPAGTPLKGFGGLANPDLLVPGLQAIANILNKAVGRQLNSLEVILITNWAGAIAVSGNIRRSAKIQEGSPEDDLFVTSKDNLWVQDAEGNWKIDPERDVLRLSNHTVVYHNKPSLETIVEAVRKQYYSGEGAIKYAPEAVARANVDLLDTEDKKRGFLALYCDNRDLAKNYLEFLSNEKGIEMSERELCHRIDRWFFNPCLLGSMRLLTVEGYKKFEDLVDTRPKIINASGSIVESHVWCSGEKEVIELSLSNKQKLVCTPDHVLMTLNGEKEAKDCKGEQLFPYLKEPEHDYHYVLLGFIQGDGTLSEGKNPVLHLGKDDLDILSLLQVCNIKHTRYPNGRQFGLFGLNDKLSALGFEMVNLPERSLPTTYNSWNKQEKAAFLNGLYSANGSVVSGRVTFKTTSLRLVEALTKTLEEDFGITSYYTTNNPKVVEFSNGSYLCKKSYDVNICQFTSRVVFFNEINFSTVHKTKKLATRIFETAPIVRAIRDYGVEKVYDFTEPLTHWGVVENFVVHNCGEIVGNTYKCNLSDVHANMLNPYDLKEQEEAFKAATLVALPLLAHEFDVEEFRYSREIDPIIGVCITGLFDFFVNLLGPDWLRWWKLGRPKKYYGEYSDKDEQILETIFQSGDRKVSTKLQLDSSLMDGKKKALYFREVEKFYLARWKNIVKETVIEFCTRNNMKVPNRFTSIAPSGSKSLLTGASPGWHPPKDTRYIRRITYSKDSPIAHACADYGYKVIPSQSCKDEFGNLLDDINDLRVNEVLVEIPVEVPWADLADKVEFKPKDITALAQLDFCMQVQQHYVGHNTSATIELRENEIEPLGRAIHELIQNDDQYISAALLARFDALETFPRLPFEPISHEKYLTELEGVQQRRISDDFLSLVNKYSTGESSASEQGPAGCDSDKCLLPERN